MWGKVESCCKVSNVMWRVSLLFVGGALVFMSLYYLERPACLPACLWFHWGNHSPVGESGLSVVAKEYQPSKLYVYAHTR